MRGLVLLGAAIWIGAEGLGFLHLLRPVPLAVWWALVAAAAWRFRPRLKFDWPRDPVVRVCGAAIAVILVLTAVVAAFSPPNSADAMAYHMPRVVYWAQQGSVQFFPTTYYNQVMLQPFAEYAMLQTYVLSGGDHFVNFVQWFASVGCIVGVAAVAGAMECGPRGQAFAALFCATLPSGILASTGAKNDYFLAMWLVAAVYFLLRGGRVELAGALGFAMLTKATAYLFAPWLAVVVGVRFWRKLWIAVPIALAINAPLYVRNYRLSGSVLGFDSASADGAYRWRNEAPGWKATVSNFLRHGSEQLGARDPGWNDRVYGAVMAAHRVLAIDPGDPATTWPHTVYGPPVNANHEANAPNRWHLLVLALVFCLAFWRRDRVRVLYALSLLCGFVAFCAVLKWQPFSARFFLPLFVLGSPLAGVLEEVPLAMSAPVLLFLIAGARPALFENWVRPLKGPRSVLSVPRERQYFSDMGQWGNRTTYEKTVDVVSALDCGTVGIDIVNLQLEYPLQAMLRARKPGIRFTHTGPACVVVCLDCAGDARRLAAHPGYGRALTVDRFLVLDQNSVLSNE